MIRLSLVALLAFVPVFAAAESWRDVRERRPELFDAETGYRIARYRAPTPDDIPGPIAVATPEETARLISGGALAIDVYGARMQRFDELNGAWLGEGERLTLPGAVWLPEVGRGHPPPEIIAYFTDELEALTAGDRDREIVIFCRADCWMSWNAARRAAALGYRRVIWYPLGVEGWEEIGRALAPTAPTPVQVD